MRKLISVLLALIPFLSFSQTDNTIVKFYNPTSVSTPKGYSHLVEIDLGKSRMILMSGQVALDKSGNLVGKDDLAKQTEQVFLNIKNMVEEIGGAMNDLVKINIYVTDASQVQIIRDVRDRFINVQQPPASTLVEVSRLFREDLLVEIEATVIIPKKLKKKK